MRFISLITIIAAALLATNARAQEPHRAERAEQLVRANDAYDKGIATLQTQPADAKRFFEEALVLYEVLIDSNDLDSSQLYYNAGNAALLAERPGLALLHYLRAQDLAPADPAIIDNIEAARERIAQREPPADPQPPTLLKARQLLNRIPGGVQTRFIAFAALFAAAWLMAIWRLLPNPFKPGIPWIIAVGTLALIVGATVVVDDAAKARDHRAVVIEAADAYDGPDDVTFQRTTTLPEGTICLVIDTRPEWTNVRLGDDRELWVQANLVERVTR